jgi:hypothetical protein
VIEAGAAAKAQAGKLGRAPQFEQCRRLLPQQQRPGQGQRQGDAQGDRQALRLSRRRQAGCSIRVKAVASSMASDVATGREEADAQAEAENRCAAQACCCQMASPRRAMAKPAMAAMAGCASCIGTSMPRVPIASSGAARAALPPSSR